MLLHLASVQSGDVGAAYSQMNIVDCISLLALHGAPCIGSKQPQHCTSMNTSAAYQSVTGVR